MMTCSLSLRRTPQNLLGPACRVSVRGVKHCQTGIQANIDETGRAGFVGLAESLEGTFPAERACPQTRSGDKKSRGSKLSMFHGCSVVVESDQDRAGWDLLVSLVAVVRRRALANLVSSAGPNSSSSFLTWLAIRSIVCWLVPRAMEAMWPSASISTFNGGSASPAPNRLTVSCAGEIDRQLHAAFGDYRTNAIGIIRLDGCRNHGKPAPCLERAPGRFDCRQAGPR